MPESSEGRLRLDIGPSYRGPRTSGLSGPHRTAPQRPATVPRATGASAPPPPAGAAAGRRPLTPRRAGGRGAGGEGSAALHVQRVVAVFHACRREEERPPGQGRGRGELLEPAGADVAPTD